MAVKSVREIAASDFVELVRGGQLVLVDFYATWCGPCKAMEPVIERLAERFAGRAKVVKVDIDKSPGLAAEYGVRGVPTFLVFAGGQSLERVVGATSEKSLAALLEEHIKQSQTKAEPEASETPNLCACSY